LLKLNLCKGQTAATSSRWAQAKKNDTDTIEMEQIDFKNTILKSRLIFKKKFDMILNIASFAMLIGFVGFVISLMILKQNVIDWIIAWSLVIIISIGLSISKWNFSMRIMKISTDKSQKDNLIIVKNFVDSKGFKYRHKSNDYIQTISNNGILWFRMESNFIIQDNEIFLNVNYFDSKINWPSFFRIKKYCNELMIES
jgi:hypothetical protein